MGGVPRPKPKTALDTGKAPSQLGWYKFIERQSHRIMGVHLVNSGAKSSCSYGYFILCSKISDHFIKQAISPR